MGCIASKRNINDLHSNMFQVVNIDDFGNRISAGHLKITRTDLILYTKNKSPISWPLNSLRRYGCAEELFSFESGRRAPTGAGVFAFKCRRAEQLFNLLQAQFTADENNAAITTPHTPEPHENGLADTPHTHGLIIRHHVESARGRVDSIGSSGVGPLSPPPVTPPPLLSPPPLTPPPLTPPPLTPQPVISPAPSTPATPASAADFSPNSGLPTKAIMEEEDFNDVACSSSTYVNIANGVDSTADEAVDRDHLYMNVVPGMKNVIDAEHVVPPKGVAILAEPISIDNLPLRLHRMQSFSLTSSSLNKLTRGASLSKLFTPDTEEIEDALVYYPNVETVEREYLPPKPNVNYIVLDLDQQPASPSVSLTPTELFANQPESPVSTTGYATIDFYKTEALTQSVHPNMEYDREGCRKTRHNPTIHDLPPVIDSNDKDGK